MLVEKRRVLLVDDEEALLSLGHAMLTRLGCDVVPCATSPEALEIFAAAPARFDLVVTDYTMPALTGAQLGVACQQLRPDLPVLLVTGRLESRGRACPAPGGWLSCRSRSVSTSSMARCGNSWGHDRRRRVPCMRASRERSRWRSPSQSRQAHVGRPYDR